MKKFLQRSFMWCSVFTPYSDKSPGDHNTPELRGAGSQLKEEMALQTVNLPTNHSFMFLMCLKSTGFFCNQTTEVKKESVIYSSSASKQQIIILPCSWFQFYPLGLIILLF